MIVEHPTDEAVFIVTDIECDGPAPGRNSMLSFAAVAVTPTGEQRDVFEAVLSPLPGATPDPQVLAWFKAQGEAWAAATTDPRPPEEALARFVAWVDGFPGARTFAAYPLAFDGLWIDYYLRRFTRFALVEGHYARGRLFDGSGLCLKSFAAGLTGRPPWDCPPSALPSEWFGGHAHTHRAIDDARGYAHLLGVLMAQSGARM